MSQRIRVLHVTETTIAGVRRHLISLLRYVDRGQFEMEVASPHDRFGDVQERGFEEEVAALGIPLHRVPMRRDIHPPTDAYALLQLTRLIRQGGYDIVHTHSSKGGILGRVAARLNGVPTVHTPNGFYFLGPHGRKKQFYLSAGTDGRAPHR